MDWEYSFLVFLTKLLFTRAKELTKRYHDTSSNKQDVHDFFEKASQEAVTLMVFFQIIAISFLILKFSSVPNLVIWLSIAFLLYTLYGPYFCLKWLLVLSSFLWHICLLLWKHPYLIASSFVGYGLFKIGRYLYLKSVSLEGEDYDLKTVVMKLDTVEANIQLLSQELGKLSTAVNHLQERVVAKSEVKEVDEEVFFNESSPYPLDRRRNISRSRR